MDDVVEDNAMWRRIDSDWLHSASLLALKMSTYINNTSLVLAFELGVGGKVLLFAGDAQRGNWISWTDAESRDGARTVTTRDLLSRTVLYKVGHHGSHNATLSGTSKDTYANLFWMAEGNYASEFTAMITAVRAWAQQDYVQWDHPPPVHQGGVTQKDWWPGISNRYRLREHETRPPHIRKRLGRLPIPCERQPVVFRISRKLLARTLIVRRQVRLTGDIGQSDAEVSGSLPVPADRGAMRRVDCRRRTAVVVEEIPWSDGKRTLTKAYMLFLARWARRLSRKETAQAFRTSWEKVFDVVEHVVTWAWNTARSARLTPSRRRNPLRQRPQVP
jgi:hypothetical protein